MLTLDVPGVLSDSVMVLQSAILMDVHPRVVTAIAIPLAQVMERTQNTVATMGAALHALAYIHGETAQMDTDAIGMGALAVVILAMVATTVTEWL